MTETTIRLKECQSPDEWQTAICQLPHVQLLQSWQWGAFKARWGWSFMPLLWQNEAGEPIAGAMVLKRTLPRLPFSIVYVPKGPLLDYANKPLRDRVLGDLKAFAKKQWAIFLKIDVDLPIGYGSDEVEPDPLGQAFAEELKQGGWLFSDDQIQFRNTVLLDISRPEADILSAMKQKTRYNIRLAGRKGIVVRPGIPADYPTIYQLYAETAERDGFAIRPGAYYTDIWQTLQNDGLAQPLIAEFEGDPVAAVIVVQYAGRAVYMYGASSGRERKRMPNYLLQWEAIRWAKVQGCTTYDFWGAPDNFNENDRLWGVWRFKSGFNGQVTHHLGAWDYPPHPLLYRLYTQLIPRYLARLRTRNAK